MPRPDPSRLGETRSDLTLEDGRALIALPFASHPGEVPAELLGFLARHAGGATA